MKRLVALVLALVLTLGLLPATALAVDPAPDGTWDTPAFRDPSTGDGRYPKATWVTFDDMQFGKIAKEDAGLWQQDGAEGFFQIRGKKDLLLAMKLTGDARYADKDFILLEDIDMNHQSFGEAYASYYEKVPDAELDDNGKAPMLNFGTNDHAYSGHFWGDGHTIKNVDYSKNYLEPKANTGLFNTTKGAEIRDLNLENFNVVSTYIGGLLVGHAEGTKIYNVTISNSNFRVEPGNNVLVLATDGGAFGGALVGWAVSCVMYNCGTKDTNVRVNNTMGVGALSGKGLYVGGLVGQADECQIEYCRCERSDLASANGKVSNYYDVAVGALGGYRIYSGGIAGKLSHTEVIDCFATNHVYFYCATYVSVGAGNVGYAGGIAATSQGGSTITRSHFSGTLESRQYNAALVIPIIQDNVNLSGLVHVAPEELTVADSYFNQELLKTAGKVGVAGDSRNISGDSGPQNVNRYQDRSFWEGQGYDFMGTADRKDIDITGSYDAVYYNKWVMDTVKKGADYITIPVHGKSSSVTFDFPGAGAAGIQSQAPTKLHDEVVSTTDPYKFARLAMYPNEGDIKYDAKGAPVSVGEVKLTFTAANADYRFVNWYKDTDVGAAGLPPEDTAYFEKLRGDDKNIVKKDGANLGNPAEHVATYDNDLFMAHVEGKVTFHDLSKAVINRDNDWYAYKTPLPQVEPTNTSGVGAGAKLIGWTTDTTKAYGAITSGELKSLKDNKDFFQTGEPIQKPMALYPVYANLTLNAQVRIEGHDALDPHTRAGVGKVSTSTDAAGNVVLKAEPLPAGAAQFPEGYRFLGWYEVTGDTAWRISTDLEHTLVGVDLTEVHTYEARFEYRVDYYVRVYEVSNGYYNGGDPKLFGQRWHRYNQPLEEITAPEYYRIALKHWSLTAQPKDGSDLGAVQAMYTGPITAPVAVYSQYEKGTGSDHLGTSYTATTDFPGSVEYELPPYENGINTHYQFRVIPTSPHYFPMFFLEESSTSREALGFTPEADGSYTSAEVTISTTVTRLVVTCVKAEVIFHQVDPATGTETTSTPVTRRYQQKVFLDSDTTTEYYYYLKPDRKVEGKSHKAEKFAFGTHTDYPGYYFAGWVDVDSLTEDEKARVFRGGDPTKGIGTTLEQVTPYRLKADAVVHKAMPNIYPVYLPYDVTTRTNVALEVENVVYKPRDPEFTPQPQSEEQVEITLTAYDKQPVDHAGKLKYTLTAITVTENDGEPVELAVTEKGETQWKAKYTVKPGVRYVFTAVYLPYVVAFHRNGDQDAAVLVRNHGDTIGEMVYACVHSTTGNPRWITDLDGTLFVGWTHDTPADPADKPYFKVDNATYQDKEALLRAVEGFETVADTSAMLVTQSWELWPVYAQYAVNVTSNLDGNLPAGYTAEDVRRAHREQEMHKDGLHVELYAADLYNAGYRFDGWYLDGVKITDENTYILSGEEPFAGNTYEARYTPVYRIIYHGVEQGNETDGPNILHVTELSEGDLSQKLVNETMVLVPKMEGGKPVLDANGDPVMVEQPKAVPLDPQPEAKLQEQMGASKVLAQWMWVKDSDPAHNVHYSDLTEPLGTYLGVGEGKVTEMHLYPRLWTLTVLDADGREINLDGSGKDQSVTAGLVLSPTADEVTGDHNPTGVGVYFNPTKPYTGQKLTVVVQRNTWRGNDTGNNAAKVILGIPNVPVTLYTTPEIPQGQSTPPVFAGPKNTDANGVAEFALNIPLDSIDAAGLGMYTVEVGNDTVNAAVPAGKTLNKSAGGVYITFPASPAETRYPGAVRGYLLFVYKTGSATPVARKGIAAGDANCYDAATGAYTVHIPAATSGLVPTTGAADGAVYTVSVTVKPAAASYKDSQTVRTTTPVAGGRVELTTANLAGPKGTTGSLDGTAVFPAVTFDNTNKDVAVSYKVAANPPLPTDENAGAMTVRYKIKDTETEVTPKDAGDYDVYVATAGGSYYLPLAETRVGAFTIQKSTTGGVNINIPVPGTKDDETTPDVDESRPGRPATAGDEDPSYEIRTVWTDSSDTVVDPTDPVKPGETYKAEVTLTPKGGYQFPDDPASDLDLTINGAEPTGHTVTKDGETVKIVYTFPATQPGTPVITVGAESFSSGKVSQITTQSAQAVKLFYFTKSDNNPMSAAQVEAQSVVADIEETPTDGTATWINDAPKMTGLAPCVTFYVYAVAKVDNTYSDVAVAQFTTPYHITVAATEGQHNMGPIADGGNNMIGEYSLYASEAEAQANTLEGTTIPHALTLTAQGVANKYAFKEWVSSNADGGERSMPSRENTELTEADWKSAELHYTIQPNSRRHVILTATFEPVYGVTYDWNTADAVTGDKPADVEANKKAADKVTVAAMDSDPVRPGYTFLGWSVKREYSKSDRLLTANDKFTVADALAKQAHAAGDSIILYAVWEAAELSIGDTLGNGDDPAKPIDLSAVHTAEYHMNNTQWGGTYALSGVVSDGTGDYKYELVALEGKSFPDFMAVESGELVVAAGKVMGCAGTYDFAVEITDNVTGKSALAYFTLTVGKQTPESHMVYTAAGDNIIGHAVVNPDRMSGSVQDKYTGAVLDSLGVWTSAPEQFETDQRDYTLTFTVGGDHAHDYETVSQDITVSDSPKTLDSDVAVSSGSDPISSRFVKVERVTYDPAAVDKRDFEVKITNNGNTDITDITVSKTADEQNAFDAAPTVTLDSALAQNGSVTFAITVPYSKGVGTYHVQYTIDATTTSGPAAATYDYTLIVDPAKITAADVALTAPAVGETPVTSAADGETYTGGAISWSPALTGGKFAPGAGCTAEVTLTARDNYIFAAPDATGFSFGGVKAAPTGEVRYEVAADGSTLKLTRTYPPLAPANVTAHLKSEYDQLTIDKLTGESEEALTFYYVVGQKDLSLTEAQIKEYVTTGKVTDEDGTDITDTVRGLILDAGRVTGGAAAENEGKRVSTWDDDSHPIIVNHGIEPHGTYKVLVAAQATDKGALAGGRSVDTSPGADCAVGEDGQSVTMPMALTVGASIGGVVTNETYFKPSADPALDNSIKGGTEKTISIHQNETFTATATASDEGWAFYHWDLDNTTLTDTEGLADFGEHTYQYDSTKNTAKLYAHFVKKMSGALTAVGDLNIGKDAVTGLDKAVTIDVTGVTIGDDKNFASVGKLLEIEGTEILWEYKDGETWKPLTRKDGQLDPVTGEPTAKGLQWTVWPGENNQYLNKQVRARLTYVYHERPRGDGTWAVEAASNPIDVTFTGVVTKQLDKPAIRVEPAETREDEDSTVNKGGLDVIITPPADAPEGTTYEIVVKDGETVVRTETVTDVTDPANIPLKATEPTGEGNRDLDPTKEYKIEVVAKPPADSGYKDSDPATATRDARGGKLTPAQIPITLADLNLDNITDAEKLFNDRIQDARKEGLDAGDPLVSLKGALAAIADDFTINVYYNPGNTVTEGQRHVGAYPIHVEVISESDLYAGTDGVIDTGKTLTITQDKPTLRLDPPTAGSKRAERFNLGSVAVTATLSHPTPDVPLDDGEHYADLNGVITEDRFTYSYVIKSVPAGYANGAYTVGQELTDGFITPDDFGTWEIWVKPKYNGIENFEKDVALPDDGVFTLVVGRRVATAVTLDNLGAEGDIDNVITYGTSGRGYDASTAETAKTWPLKGIRATFTYRGSDTPETLTANERGEFLPMEGGEKLGVVWTVERGSATIENGAVKFTTAGNITLKLSYMNASATVDLTVEPRKVTGWYTTSDGKQTGSTKDYEAGNKSVPKPGMAFDAGVVLAGDDLSLSGLVDSDYVLSTDGVGEASITVKDPTKVKLSGAQFGLYDLTGARQTWGKLTIQKKDDGGGQGGGQGGGGSSGGGAPAPAAETKHSWYMKGYPDGSFAPDAKITRAEVATIIARSCLTGFAEGKNYGNPGHYVDIQGHWAASAISFCTSKKVLEGRGNGTFDPDTAITREELALVVARLQGVKKAGKLPFTDAGDIDSWALDGVYTAYAEGWIIGYEDGSFRPRRDIARCETVKIINGYLKRKVDAKGLVRDHYRWPDVAADHWAYYEIAEATNSHAFSRKDDKTPETWTGIK